MTSVAEQQAQRTKGTVRFARRSQRGWFMGLSGLAGAVALVAIMVPVIVMVTAGAGPAFWVILLFSAPLGLTVVARTDGQRWIDWLPILAHYALRKLARQTGFRATLKARSAASMALPGDAARLRWMTAPDGSVVVFDPYTGGYTAIVRVRAEAFLLLTDAAQDDKVTGLGRLYAVLCQGSAIGRVQILESCVPDSGDAMFDWWADRGDPLTDEIARDYTDLLDVAGPASSRNESLIAITLDTGKARAALRAQKGARQEKAIKVLDQQREILDQALSAAGLPSAGWLTPAELAYEIRCAYDPAARAALDYAPSAGRDLTTAGPLAVQEHWDYLRTDTGFHAVLWIREWPRSEVFPTFLRPLLLTPGTSRRLTIVGLPRTTVQALREVQREQNELLSNQEVKMKQQKIITYADRAELADVQEREAQLVAGHGDMAFAGMITVSGRTLAELTDSVGRIRQAAIQAGCESRVLAGQQMQAFTAAALPFTRGF